MRKKLRPLSLSVLQSEHLPCDSCGGKCCSVAPFSPSELRAARLANGGSYPAGAKIIGGFPIKAKFGGGEGSIVVSDDQMTCAFLVAGRCSIYEARPRACRDYGRVPELHPEHAVRIGMRNHKQIQELLS